MAMSAQDATQLSGDLIELRGTEAADRIHDQLWLRTVLIEQRRHVRIAERSKYNARGDRVLTAIGPVDDA